MSSNSEQILHDIRADFASLLEVVMGKEAHPATVARIERGLFHRLFILGAKFLTFFFVVRAQACARQPIPNAQGVPTRARRTVGTFQSLARFRSGGRLAIGRVPGALVPWMPR